jgi:hypothetical protein
LAAILNDYEIHPTAFKIEGKTVRGYNRTSFQDAAERYLRPYLPVQSATLQPNQCLRGNAEVVQGATDQIGCTLESPMKPRRPLQSCMVALSKQEPSPEEAQEVMRI